jgi:hypothetical protein
MLIFTFTNQEVACVLAGLRLLQNLMDSYYEDEGKPWGSVLDIATDVGKYDPPTADEVGALCERINIMQE